MSDKTMLPDKCAVARDLMPLCIDGTASEASTRRVNKHVAECDPCATVYQEMQTAIELDVPTQEETEQFDTAVKKVKKTQARRKLGNVLLGVVLALVIMAGLSYGYYWYFLEEVPLPLESYELSLVERETPALAAVVIRARNVPKEAKLHINIKAEYFDLLDTGDGDIHHEMYIWATTTRNVDLTKGGYTDYDYYAFDFVPSQKGLFYVQGEPMWIDAIFQGTEADAVMRYQVSMSELAMGKTSGWGLRLRNVASMTYESGDLAVARENMVMAVVTPMVVQTPDLTQMQNALEIKEVSSTLTPMPTKKP